MIKIQEWPQGPLNTAWEAFLLLLLLTPPPQDKKAFCSFRLENDDILIVPIFRISEDMDYVAQEAVGDIGWVLVTEDWQVIPAPFFGWTWLKT